MDTKQYWVRFAEKYIHEKTEDSITFSGKESGSRTITETIGEGKNYKTRDAFMSDYPMHRYGDIKPKYSLGDIVQYDKGYAIVTTTVTGIVDMGDSISYNLGGASDFFVKEKDILSV